MKIYVKEWKKLFKKKYDAAKDKDRGWMQLITPSYVECWQNTGTE